MSYDIPSMDTPECTEAADPISLGYVPFYQGDIFTMKVDITAITIANAVSRC